MKRRIPKWLAIFIKETYALFFQAFDASISAWMSLLVILLVYALTFLEQSDTVFIALLDQNPLSLSLFILLLFFLVEVVAYYPTFIHFNRRANIKVRWFIRPIWLGMGLITFRQLKVPDPFNSRFRFALGLSLLTAVFYMITRIHFKNVLVLQGSDIEIFQGKGLLNVRTMAWTFFIAGQMTYILLDYILGMRWPDKTSNLRPHKILFYAAFAFLLIGISATLYTSTTYGWSSFSYYSFCTMMFGMALFYTIFKISRRQVILRTDEQFLFFLAMGGVLSLFVVLVAHMYPLLFNPLVIILAYFLVYYGVLIIPLKHYLYYRQFDRARPPYRRPVAYYVFSWGVPIAPFLFIGYYIYFEYIVGNDLHVLETVSQQAYRPAQKSGPVGLEEFKGRLLQHFSERDTLYFISLYGGGVKATVWDQLVLAELASSRYPNLLENTVAMSGVSGGAIGLSLFTATQRIGRDPVELAIELSMKNFASIDITYLLGRDMIFDLLGQGLLDLLGVSEDRAKRAMREYANITAGYPSNSRAPNPLIDSSFQDYWAPLFREKGEDKGFYPALLTNAAGTHAQRGIAFSVKMDSVRFDDIFLDSNNLLNFEDNRSLPYLYAASTSDRFPIFSPAAKVKTKGYFVDGGYFENSGLMSLMDFSTFLKENVFPKEERWRAKKLIFIQIANDQSVYIRDLLQHTSIRKKVKDFPEFGSIIKAVTSIGFISTYLNSKFERDETVEYVQVLLPYIVTQSDLDALYQGEVDTSGIRELVMKKNRIILDTYRSDPYALVQPPLARLLGRQAFKYMQSNLENTKIRELR
ncbi:patatin-like phospholipase family protein [Dyadobacter tibetensis]|uniref:patatin-like phospholipase family protein n=1 Tax=Dyadobacter tibetensis TaxID=1211851 RepID=UPI00046EAE5A|nr:patatin-like phospholipase family protein [Dyadobacter tibetensis]